MASEFTEEKVFKDPVHDYVYVSEPLIWRLINTKAFQRLRRVRQMGTSYLVFHGAEHSRFTHSLGTYETMRKVLSHFSRNHGWPTDERTRLLALCAALLHDVGHGPFSHAFEGVFKTHHENWTRRIVTADDEINAILSAVDSQFANDVAAIIAKESPYSLIVALISSQLDVDRMDYLLRDALHTGVIYGEYELERLIRVMRPYHDKIVVKQSGIHTVEQYVLARYFMYSQVYLHPTTIGSDVLLRKIMMRARSLYLQGQLEKTPTELRPFFEKEEANITLPEYLALDESIIIYAFHQWSTSQDPILRDLASRFLNRQLFSSISCSFGCEADVKLLENHFAAAGIDPEYYLSTRSITTEGYLYKEGIRYITEEGSRVRLAEISHVSNLIRSLVPETRQRLYFPKDWLQAEERLHPLLKEVQQLSQAFSVEEPNL